MATVGYYRVTNDVATGRWAGRPPVSHLHNLHVRRNRRVRFIELPGPGAGTEQRQMSDFSMELNEDQLQIQKWVHDFAETVVRPAGHEWDEREETPWPIIEEAAKIGLYSFDFITQCFLDPSGLLLPIANEEMAWGDAGIGLAIFGSVLGLAGIAANGTPEQLMEWGPRCFGTPEKIQTAAFAVSEPDAGSDVSSLRTRAVYDEAKDEWVINGTKTWITNGGIADIHVVVASVVAELGSRGQASFIVPPKTPGLSQGQKFQKMGIRASHTAEVILHDVRVPGHCLLGGKDKLDEKLARAREGKKSTSQADMKTRIDASRMLVWRAAWMGSNGKEFTAGEGSMSKLYAGETAVYVTEEAIQIMGGYGYIREHPVERWHRDSKIYTIFEGTSEIQRLIIARAISGVHIK